MDRNLVVRIECQPGYTTRRPPALRVIYRYDDHDHDGSLVLIRPKNWKQGNAEVNP